MGNALAFEDIHAQLAATLRQRRLTAEITGQQLSAAANMSKSKLSKIERCRVVPSFEDVRLLADNLKLDAASHEELMQLVAMLHENAVDRSADSSTRAAQRRAMAIEATAHFIQNCDVIVSGLLQTPDYTRAVLRKIVRMIEEDHVEDIVVDRLRRQALVADRTRTFQFLMPEAVLLSPIASADVMKVQVEKMHEVASSNNVELRLVPSGVESAVVMQNFYMILDSSVVLQEGLFVDVLVRDEASVAAFKSHFDRGWNAALSAHESLELLEFHSARFGELTSSDSVEATVVLGETRVDSEPVDAISDNFVLV